MNTFVSNRFLERSNCKRKSNIVSKSFKRLNSVENISGITERFINSIILEVEKLDA